MADQTTKPASLADVRKYFDMDPAEFRKEWLELSAEDKAAIRQGLGDGSMTY